MQYYAYPALQDGYYEQVLPNGLTVRVMEKKDFAKKYAFLAVNYGSMDMDFMLDGSLVKTPAGVAHFLEHKMFDMPYGDAMNRFATLGGNPNAFTSHSMTAYYAECTHSLPENLQTLLEFVFTPYFTQKSVDKEQGIIAEEIRMYRDNADSRVYEILLAALYDGHPVSVSIAGTEGSIAAITADTLHSCHKAFYTPANAMLCVMGDVNREEILSLAQEFTPAVAAPRAQAVYPCGNPISRKTVRESMEVSMPTFLLGFRGTPPALGRESMKREFVGDLAADLLLGASSPLYTKLYEEGLIDTSFSAGYESMKHVSFFSAGGDSEHPEKVAEEILKESEKLLSQGLDEERFLRLKKATLGRKLRELDGFESTCFRSCAYFFEQGNYFDSCEILSSICLRDVQDYIEACLRPENMALSIVDPKH